MRVVEDTPPPERSANPTVRQLIDAALELGDGQSIEVGADGDARLTSYKAVMSANRKAGRKVLRSYNRDGVQYVTRVAAAL